MSLKTRVEKLEAAPLRNNDLRERIQEARERMARMGHPLPDHEPLTEEEERQIKSKGLADTLKFFRLKYLNRQKEI
jgi:hypothetical protein